MPHCNVFRPEDEGAVTDGTTDCLMAFQKTIAKMHSNDILLLTCAENGFGYGYLLSDVLEIDQEIVIQGDTAPHYVDSLAQIRSAPGKPGLRLFRKCTLANLYLWGGANVQAIYPVTAASVDGNNLCTVTVAAHDFTLDDYICTSGLRYNTGRARVVAFTPTTVTFPLVRAALPDNGTGYVSRANHGIWSRNSLRLSNLKVDSYAGDGIFFDTNTQSAVTTSVVVDAAGTATVTTQHPHGMRPGMAITSEGWPTELPAAGAYILTVSDTQLTVHIESGPWTFTDPARIYSIERGSHWHVDNVRVTHNGGHGFHTLGPDSNAGLGVNVDGTSNHGVGLWDESFLGNTYLACHTAANGYGSYVKPAGSASNRSIFLGCYAEGGQAPPLCTYPASRYAGSGAWTGTGLANGWSVGYLRPSSFYNDHPNNNYTANIAASNITNTVLAITMSRVFIQNNRRRLECTVGPGHGLAVGQTIVTTGLRVYNTPPEGAPLVAVSTDTVTALLDNGPAEPMNGSGTLTAAILTVTSPGHGLQPGNVCTTTGLANDITDPQPVLYRTVDTVGFSFRPHPDVPDNWVAGAGLLADNTLRFEIGGSTDCIFAYRSDMASASQFYRKQYLHVRNTTGTQWFVTRWNNNPAGVCEAESGPESSDDAGVIGAGHKWFPNGLYFGRLGAMSKLDALLRANNEDHHCFTLRESGAQARVRAIAWSLAPPSGTGAAWAAGDIVWNDTPSATSPIGWVCTSNPPAAPGTWLEMPRLNAVADPRGRSIQEVIRFAFTALAPGAVEDILIYNADCPGAMRILDVQLLISTASGGTLQLRSATGGLGAALSGSFNTATAGRFRDTGTTATPLVPNNGTVCLRRTNRATAGEVILFVQR